MSPADLRLPAAAMILVAAVLGIQLARGGGDFSPLRAADPCAAREVTSRAAGIDGLSERLVLLGFDGAACTLGLGREALVLRFAGPGRRTDAEIEALRDGLQGAVRRMQADGSLPPASALVDDALDQTDLNGFLKAAIRAVPDAVIDGALKTDDVLSRAIDDLDLRRLLADLEDQDALEEQIEQAVTRAVRESLEARLRGLV